MCRNCSKHHHRCLLHLGCKLASTHTLQSGLQKLFPGSHLSNAFGSLLVVSQWCISRSAVVGSGSAAQHDFKTTSGMEKYDYH